MSAGGHKCTEEILDDLKKWGENNNSRVTAAVVVVNPCNNILNLCMGQ